MPGEGKKERGGGEKTRPFSSMARNTLRPHSVNVSKTGLFTSEGPTKRSKKKKKERV